MESAVTPRWAIFTNHGHVLIHVWNNPAARIRDIAQAVGLTERTTLVLLRDLEHANYLTRERSGNRNRYTVRQETPLHHPAEQGPTVSHLLEAATRTTGRSHPPQQPNRLVF